jgi:succinate dehydrogenase/fumarate reductase flavoprotein subunit
MEGVEADVLIVGYGGAGATAAIAAHDAGAKVVVIEKMPSGGGNTQVSGGAFFTPVSAEKLERSVRYVEQLCFGTTGTDVIRAFLENALQTNDWIRSLGGESVPFPPFRGDQFPRPPIGPAFPNVDGAGNTTSYCIQGDEAVLKGQRLWDLLARNVERRGINVMTGTPAKELVIDGGAVTGVRTEKSLVKARKAVILACGGFEYNEAMKEAYLACKPFHAAGSPSTTGDGIVMAQKAGAALWHMNVVAGWFGFKAPEYPWAITLRYCGPKFIHVNRRGRRFSDELAHDYHDRWRHFAGIDASEKTATPGHPDIPAYGIFDEPTRLKGSLRFRVTHPTGRPEDSYDWSADNSKEVAKGWIKRGDTLGELAERSGINAASLEETIARYNAFCKAGKDSDFGRDAETLAPIDTPPYYSIEIWPTMLNTLGGPRRDKNARVLAHDGRPIPGLYGAGELGSIWGFIYNGGGNLAECLAFGRIAGRNAAREKDRS